MTEINCGLCGQSEAWHREHKPRHQFQGASSSLNEKEKPQVQMVRGTTGDPVLRLALIDAGIITYEHIALAEEKFRAARDSGSPAYAGGYEHPAASPTELAGGSPAHPGNGDRSGPV